MNIIKRLLGIVWIALSPYIIYQMFLKAIEKISAAAPAVKTNVTLQWSIILFIFIPCCIGLIIFGWYAVKGEYDHLPTQSEEV
ncbi:MAG: hypothetical protein ORN58_07155 [Sediminibacterium sp.]|nr:hypothetical protein [Sediminibacterium sp.]